MNPDSGVMIGNGNRNRTVRGSRAGTRAWIEAGMPFEASIGSKPRREC